MSDAKLPKGNKTNTPGAPEIEMINTGDTDLFKVKDSESNERNAGLAKPKGEQTRNAMAEVLASKLKGAIHSHF